MPRLTQKGQVTIPKAMRRLLGLQTGDEVEFVVRDGHVEIRPAMRENKSLYALLKLSKARTASSSDDDAALDAALLEDDRRIRGNP